jgi:hypothetical protein
MAAGDPAKETTGAELAWKTAAGAKRHTRRHAKEAARPRPSRRKVMDSINGSVFCLE